MAITKTVLFAVAMTIGSAAAYASAVDVSYTVSGSPGAWDLNFAVTNNMTAWPAQDVYQFGVLLSAGNVTGSPTGYDPTMFTSWTNFFNGGGPFLYKNIWVDLNDFNHLLPGQSLSGFTVGITDAEPPVSVQWFALSVPDTFDPADIYTGTDAFNIDSGLLTAGFEGVGTQATATSATPEPSTGMAGLISGIVLGCACRKSRHNSDQ